MNKLEGIWTGIVAVIVLGSLCVWLIAWGRPLNTFVATTVTPAQERQSDAANSGVLPTPTQTGARAVAVANKDVATIVANISGVSEFRSLLYSSGVSAAIGKGGKYTIFVPNNAAFARLPRGTITNLTSAERKRLVQYHVISGAAIDPGAIVAGSKQTLSGDVLNFSAAVGGTPMVGSANIVAEYSGTNGTVYVIDGVLLPPKRLN